MTFNAAALLLLIAGLALIGWLAFGEELTLPTLAGTVLVVAACWVAVPRRRPEQSAL